MLMQGLINYTITSYYYYQFKVQWQLLVCFLLPLQEEEGKETEDEGTETEEKSEEGSEEPATPESATEEEEEQTTAKDEL